MHRLLTKRRDDEGFTLIELLVVVVIIGVLVAIAIPVYLNYREGAANKSAQSDVRGAIAAVEQYYTENGNSYPASKNGTESQNLVLGSGASAQTATVSDGTTLSYQNNSTSYVLCARNKGGGQVFVYNSSSGGSVKKSQQSSVSSCLSNGN
jgi:type IV pilus assembly protein PilA